MHHRLLHKQRTVEQRAPVKDKTEVKRAEDNGTSKNRRAEQDNVSTDRATFLTEGNDPAQETTMLAQSGIRPAFIG